MVERIGAGESTPDDIFIAEKGFKILGFLINIATTDRPATTIREIQEELGFSSTSIVKYHLDVLEHEGYTTSLEKKANTIRLSRELTELVEPHLKPKTE